MFRDISKKQLLVTIINNRFSKLFSLSIIFFSFNPCLLDNRKNIIIYLLFNLSVGVYKNGRVEIIANDQGNRITPSYVAFTKEGERLIGDAAKNQLTTNPENTVFDAKRLIGRDWSDTNVQHDVKFFPFKVNNSIIIFF